MFESETTSCPKLPGANLTLGTGVFSWSVLKMKVVLILFMSSGGAASEPLLKSTSIEAIAALEKSLVLSGKDLQDFIVHQQEFEREERRSAREARKTEQELSNRQKEKESEERRREAEAQEGEEVPDAEAEERQKQREHDLASDKKKNIRKDHLVKTE